MDYTEKTRPFTSIRNLNHTIPDSARIKRIDNGERTAVPLLAKFPQLTRKYYSYADWDNPLSEGDLAKIDIADAFDTPTSHLHFSWLMDCVNSNGSVIWCKLKDGSVRETAGSAYTIRFADNKPKYPAIS